MLTEIDKMINGIWFIVIDSLCYFIKNELLINSIYKKSKILVNLYVNRWWKIWKYNENRFQILIISSITNKLKLIVKFL